MLSAEGTSPFLMAIATKKLVEPRRIRFKRQLGDRRAALGTLPITLECLSLESLSTTIIVKFHFLLNAMRPFGLRIQQNGLRSL